MVTETVETGRFNDDGREYWMWGIYDGNRLVTDSAPESYATEDAALKAGKLALADIHAGAEEINPYPREFPTAANN